MAARGWGRVADVAHPSRDHAAGTYTYTTADLRASVDALALGAFGDLSWVEERPLAAGQQAFLDLDQGRCAAAKVLLRP